QAKTINGNHITADRIDARVLVQDGTTITDLIAANAATDASGAFGDGGVGVGGSNTAVIQIAVNNPSGAPIIIFGDIFASVTANSGFSGGNYDSSMTMWLDRNGTTLRTQSISISLYYSGTGPGSSSTNRDTFTMGYYDASPGSGVITYTIYGRKGGNSGSAQASKRFLAALVKKR
ncbi:hypothetical protein B9J07_28315, partial [Sinorhizobium sp. LM21]